MLCLLFFAALATSMPQARTERSFSLPLVQKTVSGVHVPRALWRYIPITSKAGEVNDQNFWFANFTIGEARNLEILVDTGSADLLLNPDIYKPSPFSVDLHKNYSITFSTTNPDGSGTVTLSGPEYKDFVALEGTPLFVTQQTLGTQASPETPPVFPHDGLMGFSQPAESSLSAKSWFYDLCDQGSLDQCRFGLAFNTDKTGTQYFGDVAHEAFLGPLSIAPLPQGPWALYGDIAFDGEVIEKQAYIQTDSGTTIIFGPLDSVQKLFDAAGIQSVLRPNTTADEPTTLDGYYSCSNPPKLGFGFPSQEDAASAKTKSSSSVSHSSTIFNVLESQLAETRNGDNCTAVIHGIDAYGEQWILGQAFFEGRYIDHNVAGNTMGFANLFPPQH